MLSDLNDLSQLFHIHTLGLSRNLIRNPTPILELPKLRRLTLSFNQIPTDQTSIKDLFRQSEARGIYINSRNQSPFLPRVQSLVKSLIGHPSSNAIFGDYLRAQGYARLVDLLLDSNIKEDDLKFACIAWEKALKFEKPLGELAFPGK